MIIWNRGLKTYLMSVKKFQKWSLPSKEFFSPFVFCEWQYFNLAVFVSFCLSRSLSYELAFTNQLIVLTLKVSSKTAETHIRNRFKKIVVFAINLVWTFFMIECLRQSFCELLLYLFYIALSFSNFCCVRGYIGMRQIKMTESNMTEVKEPWSSG